MMITYALGMLTASLTKHTSVSVKEDTLEMDLPAQV